MLEGSPKWLRLVPLSQERCKEEKRFLAKEIKLKKTHDNKRVEFFYFNFQDYVIIIVFLKILNDTVKVV